MAEAVQYAFLHSMTPLNNTSGFKKTGIFPHHSEIFIDEDFATVETTDQADPSLEEQLDQAFLICKENTEDIMY